MSDRRVSHQRGTMGCPYRGRASNRRRGACRPMECRLNNGRDRLTSKNSVCLLSNTRLLLTRRVRNERGATGRHRRRRRRNEGRRGLMIRHKIMGILHDSIRPKGQLPNGPLQEQLQARFANVIASSKERMKSSRATLHTIRNVNHRRRTKHLSLRPVLFRVAKGLRRSVYQAYFGNRRDLVVYVKGHYRTRVDKYASFVCRATKRSTIIVIRCVRVSILCLRVNNPKRRCRGRTQRGRGRLKRRKITRRLLRFLFGRGLCRGAVFWEF